VDRRKFQYVEMDTDSAYMALSAPLHLTVRKELRRQFWEEYGDWFPAPFCQEHKEEFVRVKMEEYQGGPVWTPESCCKKRLKHDARTPGLFKEEFSGAGIVALNSKTYVCWERESVKYSSKGLSKATNSFGPSDYLGVLDGCRSVTGVNKGFVTHQNRTYTYKQSRTGLTSPTCTPSGGSWRTE